MIPWSGYRAADLRGTVKCDRTISLRIDLRERGRNATTAAVVLRLYLLIAIF
jgi:hypothetical protein